MMPTVSSWDLPDACTILLLLLIALPGAAPLAGQQEGTRTSARAVTPAAAMEPLQTIGRLHYEGGGDWYANPSSLPNLLAAVRARTGIPVEREERTVRSRPTNCGACRTST